MTGETTGAGPGASDALRAALASFQDWGDAHLTLDAALERLAPEHRGVRPPGLPHSVWELVEHVRIAQRDLLDFCTAERYKHPAWPDEYWPHTPAPADDAAWERALAALHDDLEGLRRVAGDDQTDLLAPTRHATEPHQTVLRALLISQDHLSYHIGQIVLVRRVLEGR
jgi:uncharacterized damage-inducible protein DinB